MRLWMLLLSLFATGTVSGQQYELLLPDGTVNAQVDIARGRMTLTEANGNQHLFLREPRYDSGDGQYLGYFNDRLNRVVRFPQSGSGRLQTADLDEPTPRFRFTRRTVEPAPAGPPVSWQGVLPLSPAMQQPNLWLDPRLYRQGYGYQPNLYRQSIKVQSRFVPNPPLPDVRIELFNGGRRDLQVALIDRRDPAANRSLQIRPGEKIPFRAERDSGGTALETFQTYSDWGELISKEVRRPVRPMVRYEIVVHQWEMQSVAIDRTGKSPNRIEDINYQGRGLGRFVLPPGEQLTSGTVDVYRTAVESGQDSTVAPILASEDDQDGPSPLERAVLEAQRRAQGR